MEYKLQQLLNVMTKNTGVHRFIDKGGCPNWIEIMNQLVHEYGNLTVGKPSAIFFDDFTITRSPSEQLSKSHQIHSLRLLSEYYRYLIAYNLVTHIQNSKLDIEKSVLTTFRFGEKPSDVCELLHMLKIDLTELKKFYEKSKHDDLNQPYNPKIRFLGLDSLPRNIEMETGIDWFCNLYFNAGGIDKDTATILNDYISSRIGGVICFNICYDSKVGYPTFLNSSKVSIDATHDYQRIKLKEWSK